jgi:hypothetical protein
VSIEVAETQMRAEQNPTSHMMPMSGNQVLNPAEMNYRGGGSPMDHLPLFEALGCLLGLRGVIHAPLVIETEEVGRGRQRILLSDQAAAALRDVFDESCAPSAVGMGQREIEAYLQRCGVDSATVPTQKIVDIMAKYPTTGGNGKATSSLSLEGFLAYYRDTAQTNEIRVSKTAGYGNYRRFFCLTNIVAFSSLHVRFAWICTHLGSDLTCHVAHLTPGCFLFMDASKSGLAWRVLQSMSVPFSRTSSRMLVILLI